MTGRIALFGTMQGNVFAFIGAVAIFRYFTCDFNVADYGNFIYNSLVYKSKQTVAERAVDRPLLIYEYNDEKDISTQ